MHKSLSKSTALSAAALAGIACLSMAQPAGAQWYGNCNGPVHEITVEPMVNNSSGITTCAGQQWIHVSGYDKHGNYVNYNTDTMSYSGGMTGCQAVQATEDANATALAPTLLATTDGVNEDTVGDTCTAVCAPNSPPPPPGGCKCTATGQPAVPPRANASIIPCFSGIFE